MCSVFDNNSDFGKILLKLFYLCRLLLKRRFFGHSLFAINVGLIYTLAGLRNSNSIPNYFIMSDLCYNYKTVNIGIFPAPWRVLAVFGHTV